MKRYANQKGTGTEHLMINFMDKLLKLLDNNSNCSAVIASLVDWASAFDRQDPTLAIQKSATSPTERCKSGSMMYTLKHTPYHVVVPKEPSLD